MLTTLNISSTATVPFESEFHAELPGVEESKICTIYPYHITNIAAMPIYGNTLENLLQNQLTEGL